MSVITELYHHSASKDWRFSIGECLMCHSVLKQDDTPSCQRSHNPSCPGPAWMEDPAPQKAFPHEYTFMSNARRHAEAGTDGTALLPLISSDRVRTVRFQRTWLVFSLPRSGGSNRGAARRGRCQFKTKKRPKTQTACLLKAGRRSSVSKVELSLPLSWTETFLVQETNLLPVSCEGTTLWSMAAVESKLSPSIQPCFCDLNCSGKKSQNGTMENRRQQEGSCWWTLIGKAGNVKINFCGPP